MVIESQKTRNIEGELSPCVTFVSGYPHREVFEPDEDGLKESNSNFSFLTKFDNTTNYLSFLEVGVLNNLGWEFKLERHHN